VSKPSRPAIREKKAPRRTRKNVQISVSPISLRGPGCNNVLGAAFAIGRSKKEGGSVTSCSFLATGGKKKGIDTRILKDETSRGLPYGERRGGSDARKKKNGTRRSSANEDVMRVDKFFKTPCAGRSASWDRAVMKKKNLRSIEGDAVAWVQLKSEPWKGKGGRFSPGAIRGKKGKG